MLLWCPVLLFMLGRDAENAKVEHTKGSESLDFKLHWNQTTRGSQIRGDLYVLVSPESKRTNHARSWLGPRTQGH